MPTYREVVDMVYTIKDEVASLGEQIMYNLWYGYRVGEDTLFRIKKLSVLHRFLEGVMKAMRNHGVLCLNCSQVQIVVEGVRKLIRRKCEGNYILGLDSDSSKRAEWSVQNPFCIGHDRWEASMFAVSEKINFNLGVVDKSEACKLSYELVKKDISCELFVAIAKKATDCKIKYNILADEKDCELKYAGFLKKRECKLKYDLLVKKTSCKLEFHDYVNIINCGVSADLIHSVYDCGLTLRFNQSSACPVLVTSAGTSFSFDSFTVENEEQLLARLKSLGIV